MRFRAVTRGTFRQVVNASDGTPVDLKLFRCVVDKAPYVRGAKTYVALDLIDALGDLDVLRALDEFIERSVTPEFSPLRPPLVIVKVPRDVSYEDAEGAPGPPLDLKRGDEIDVMLRPGAFGAFGYCLLLTRVKPHAVV